jgi:Rrf2 family protein
MAKLFKISDAASLGLHAMAVLATNEQTRQTLHNIASELNVSVNHLAKVVQRLVKTGLVESERGPAGGIRLARTPDKINFMQVYEAVEGPMDENYCLLGRNSCNPTDCILGGLMESVNNEVRDYFTKTTLDRFVAVHADKPVE